MIKITDKEFNELAIFIKNNSGVNLTPEKKILLMTRLNQTLEEKNFGSFTEFYNYVISDKTGEAITTLINKVTTNHTYFFRENKHYNYLIKTVLPYLYKAERNKKDLRIWSAGCSSGEEPYTLAMLLDSFFADKDRTWDSKILATDISTNVLKHAINGIYNEESLWKIPNEVWKLKYFNTIENNKYKVVDKIRKEVIFKRFNLMNKKFPFKKKFHVIFCRNVMIYFDAKTKNELIQRFYDITEPGGYLFIGHSETLDKKSTGFKYIMPAVYRKE